MHICTNIHKRLIESGWVSAQPIARGGAGKAAGEGRKKKEVNFSCEKGKHVSCVCVCLCVCMCVCVFACLHVWLRVCARGCAYIDSFSFCCEQGKNASWLWLTSIRTCMHTCIHSFI
jgi:hypothetical protein